MEKLEEKNFRRRFLFCWPKMWNSFSTYSEESSIHSMNYIGKRNIHWIERVFWILAFLFSLSSCSFLIYKTYKKWDNDPVLVTFNERSTPTRKIPFPAITICPESKTNINKFNLTEMIEKHRNNETLSKQGRFVLQGLSQTCEFKGFRLKRFLPTNNYMKTLQEVQTDFSNRSRAEIFQQGQGFLESFNEIFTDEGICYTFNMLDEKDLFKASMSTFLRYPKEVKRSTWNVFGYEDNIDPHAYPHRISGSGVSSGIQIQLAMRKKDVDYSCKSTSGFRIILHTPDELPKLSEHFYSIPFDFKTLINVLPRKMSTSDNLKRYLPKQRQCYFRGEKRLQFFKHYNLANCKLECLSNFTLKMCGCVKFSMPSSNGTKVCSNDRCMKRHENDWRMLEQIDDVLREDKQDSHTSKKSKMLLKKSKKSMIKFLDKYQRSLANSTINLERLKEELIEYDHDEYDDGNEDAELAFKSCHCLPACSSIRYDAEISQTKVNMEKHLKTTNKFENDEDEMLYSLVTIYFKDDEFIESKRSELYGWINFLSNCGGFLGLLMGGSLLSLVEILYHLMIKKVFEKTQHKVTANDEETGSWKSHITKA